MPVHARTIRINDARKVLLKVEIGQAQIASTIVTVGDKERIERRKDSFTLDLGAGLAGKKVTCSTMVQDMRRQTNRTSVTYTVSNEGVDETHTLAQDASSDGDIVSYIARFRFRART